MECKTCWREKILSQKCVVGFPDHHIAGSLVEYCGFCDIPPVIELVSGDHEDYVLVKNKPNGSQC